jgi:hypothetical protein
LRKPKVVLVGESGTPHSDLARRVAGWGAECHFAASYKEVRSLLRQQTFDLILGEMHLGESSAMRLVPHLEGTATSLICSFPIEDSCVWLQIVDRGRAVRDVPLLRPNEFGVLLHRTLTEQRSAEASCAAQKIP